MYCGKNGANLGQGDAVTGCLHELFASSGNALPPAEHLLHRPIMGAGCIRHIKHECRKHLQIAHARLTTYRNCSTQIVHRRCRAGCYHSCRSATHLHVSR